MAIAQGAIDALAAAAEEWSDYELLVSIGGGHPERDLRSMALEFDAEIVRLETILPRRWRWLAWVIPSHGALFILKRPGSLSPLFWKAAPYSLCGVYLVPTRSDRGLRRQVGSGDLDKLDALLRSRSDVAGYTFDLDQELGTRQIGRDVPRAICPLPSLDLQKSSHAYSADSSH